MFRLAGHQSVTLALVRKPQHLCDATIAITAVLGGERDDVGGHSRLIIARLRDLALRRAMLAQDTAGKPPGDAVLSDQARGQGRALICSERFQIIRRAYCGIRLAGISFRKIAKR
jgi:hypothetical protein